MERHMGSSSGLYPETPIESFYADPDSVVDSICELCGISTEYCAHAVTAPSLNETTIYDHPEWPQMTELDEPEPEPEPPLPYLLGSDYRQPLANEIVRQLDDDASTVQSSIVGTHIEDIYTLGDRLKPSRGVQRPSHRREAPRPGGFPCTVDGCGKAFDRSCDLKRHQKTHLGRPERPFQCKVCPEEFRYPKDRDRHQRTHDQLPSSPSMFFCPVPGCANVDGFSRRDNLFRHQQKQHPHLLNASSQFSGRAFSDKQKETPVGELETNLSPLEMSAQAETLTPNRGGIALLKDPPGGKNIAPTAQWTKIRKQVVGLEALHEAEEPFVEVSDHFIVLRSLGEQVIQRLTERTKAMHEARRRLTELDAPAFDVYDDTHASTSRPHGFHRSVVGSDPVEIGSASKPRVEEQAQDEETNQELEQNHFPREPSAKQELHMSGDRRDFRPNEARLLTPRTSSSTIATVTTLASESSNADLDLLSASMSTVKPTISEGTPSLTGSSVISGEETASRLSTPTLRAAESTDARPPPTDPEGAPDKSQKPTRRRYLPPEYGEEVKVDSHQRSRSNSSERNIEFKGDPIVAAIEELREIAVSASNKAQLHHDDEDQPFLAESRERPSLHETASWVQATQRQSRPRSSNSSRLLVRLGGTYACSSCIGGHRVSSCQHSNRELFHIDPKGRRYQSNRKSTREARPAQSELKSGTISGYEASERGRKVERALDLPRRETSSGGLNRHANPGGFKSNAAGDLPSSLSGAPYKPYSWSQRLHEYCSAEALGEPVCQILLSEGPLREPISQEAVSGGTKLSSFVMVQHISYQASRLHDSTDIEQAREDAAEMALRQLVDTAHGIDAMDAYDQALKNSTETAHLSSNAQTQDTEGAPPVPTELPPEVDPLQAHQTQIESMQEIPKDSSQSLSPQQTNEGAVQSKFMTEQDLKELGFSPQGLSFWDDIIPKSITSDLLKREGSIPVQHSSDNGLRQANEPTMKKPKRTGSLGLPISPRLGTVVRHHETKTSPPSGTDLSAPSGAHSLSGQSSASSSKPAPITRYSGSFSYRRSMRSISYNDVDSKTEEVEDLSIGKGEAASLPQPASVFLNTQEELKPEEQQEPETHQTGTPQSSSEEPSVKSSEAKENIRDDFDTDSALFTRPSASWRQPSSLSASADESEASNTDSESADNESESRVWDPPHHKRTSSQSSVGPVSFAHHLYEVSNDKEGVPLRPARYPPGGTSTTYSSRPPSVRHSSYYENPFAAPPTRSPGSVHVNQDNLFAPALQSPLVAAPRDAWDSRDLHEALPQAARQPDYHRRRAQQVKQMMEKASGYEEDYESQTPTVVYSPPLGDPLVKREPSNVEVTRRPPTRDGSRRTVKPEIIIEFGSKQDKSKKYKSPIVPTEPHKRMPLDAFSVAPSDEVHIDSPGSESSYEVRTGFPEAPIEPSADAFMQSQSYFTKLSAPRSPRYVSSASSFATSTQPPSLYAVTEADDFSERKPSRYSPKLVHNPLTVAAVLSPTHGANILVPEKPSQDDLSSDGLTPLDYSDFVDDPASSRAAAPDISDHAADRERLRGERISKHQQEADRSVAQEIEKLEKEEAKQVRFEFGRAEARAQWRTEHRWAEHEKKRAEEREEERQKKNQQQEGKATQAPQLENKTDYSKRSKKQQPIHTRRQSTTKAEAEAQLAHERRATAVRGSEDGTEQLRQQHQKAEEVARHEQIEVSKESTAKASASPPAVLEGVATSTQGDGTKVWTSDPPSPILGLASGPKSSLYRPILPEEELRGKAVALLNFEPAKDSELPLVEGQIVVISCRLDHIGQEGKQGTSAPDLDATKTPAQSDTSKPDRGDTNKPKHTTCTECRKRKLRCDGTRPECGTCKSHSHNCAYPEGRRKSGPKRGYVKLLESRLQQVETLLKDQETSSPVTRGWVFAEDPKTGRSGLVPQEYVKMLRGIEGDRESLKDDTIVQQKESSNSENLLSRTDSAGWRISSGSEQQDLISDSETLNIWRGDSKNSRPSGLEESESGTGQNETASIASETARSLNPTVEDYQSDDEVVVLRRSPAANVAAKRSPPADLESDKTSTASHQQLHGAFDFVEHYEVSSTISSYRSGSSAGTGASVETADTEYNESHRDTSPTLGRRRRRLLRRRPPLESMPLLEEESPDEVLVDDSYEYWSSEEESDTCEPANTRRPEEVESSTSHPGKRPEAFGSGHMSFRRRKETPAEKLESEVSRLERSAEEAPVDNPRPPDSIGHLQMEQEGLGASLPSENPTRTNVRSADDKMIETETHLERAIRIIVAQVLGRDESTIHRHDDFFLLGGDSLSAIEVSRAAREQNIRIHFFDLLRHPVLVDTARKAAVLSNEGQSPNLRPSNENAGGQQEPNTEEPLLVEDSKIETDHEPYEPHLLKEIDIDDVDWKDVQTRLPESWMWDVDYHTTHSAFGKDHGSWTCTPMEAEDPKNFPLTIAGTPVVLPVETSWPPMGGVNPPPDPRPSAPIDCSTEVSLDVIRDVLLTFEGSIGFYLLINGLLQIIIPEGFDTTWASSHLPHKFGGLKVSYIPLSMDPTTTLFPSKTETMKSKSSQSSQSSTMSNIFRQSRPSNISLTQPLRLNDFIEARTKSSHRKEKFAGRIGLKLTKCGQPYLAMSTHVITEAILSKSHIAGIFGRSRDRFEKLDANWNEHVEIWAGNENIGTIENTFDDEAEIYPNGFKHDITLINPSNAAAVKDIKSPVPNLGWSSKESWHLLRQQTSRVKILGDTENHRAGKSLRTSRPSDVLVVGEGIFLNQTSAPKPSRDHDISTWKDLVSRAVLYRVYPDFDPPNGYSGVALYADGVRGDGSEGPGVVGLQSFVQRSGHVQNFEMEGVALEKRLKLGRVAFYGAFQIPEVLRKDYEIV